MAATQPRQSIVAIVRDARRAALRCPTIVGRPAAFVSSSPADLRQRLAGAGLGRLARRLLNQGS